MRPCIAVSRSLCGLTILMICACPDRNPAPNPPPANGNGDDNSAITWNPTATTVDSAPELQLAFNNTRVAARDSQDALHVVFADGQNLHHGVLALNATSWTVRPLIKLNGDSRATKPTLAIINDDLILAAWMELRGGQRSVVVTRSLNRGQLWEPPLLIAQGNFDEPLSLYAFTRNAGNPGAVLAWRDEGLNRVVSTAWRGTLWAASDWTFPQSLSTGLLTVARDVAVSGSGQNLVAAWEDNRFNPQFDIFIAQSFDGGLNWSIDSLLPVPPTAATQGQDPGVALRTADRVYIAFQNQGNVFLTTSVNAATTFAEPRLLGPGLFAHVAVNDLNAGAVAWEHFTGNFQDDSLKTLGLTVSLNDFVTLLGPHALPGSASVTHVVQPAVTLSDELIDVFWVDVSGAGARVLRHRSGRLP